MVTTGPMIVNSSSLAEELRRRRVGRRALIDSLRGSRGRTWLPCELHETPTHLLMLAAMSLAQPGARRSSPG